MAVEVLRASSSTTETIEVAEYDEGEEKFEEMDDLLDNTHSFDDASVGSIEIEAVDNPNTGRILISRIVFHSPNAKEPPLIIDCPRPSTIPEEKELSYSEVLDGIYDNFVQYACLGCDTGGCGTMGGSGDLPAKNASGVKSALKKTKSEDPSVSSDRSVSFSSLKIREYNVTLGDNPSAKSGPPTMLEWEPTSESVIDLETYENARQPRRHRRKLKLSYRDKERILLGDRGFSKDEVRDAWVAAIEIRKQRRETITRAGSINEKVDEVWESAHRKFWRLLQYETL